MPGRDGSSAANRKPVELLEAELEFGFSLIDLVDRLPSDTPQLLSDADVVYQNIQARLRHLEFSGSPTPSIFEPLVSELRRSIDMALVLHGGKEFDVG